jgi:anti-sigma factor RsiW
MTGAVTDELLMALADGELPEGEASDLRTRIASDPELAERFALFAETAALLAPDDPAAAAELPDHLRASVLRMANETAVSNGQPVNPLSRFAVVAGGAPKPEVAASAAPQATAAPRRTVQSWYVPLAASVALMIGGVLGYGLQGVGGDKDTLELATFQGARPALASALASLPSGETRAWSDQRGGRSGTLAVVATHRMAGGAICREAEVSGAAEAGKQTVIACRKDGRWITQALIATGGTTGFSPASGAHAVAEQVLEALGSQSVLSKAEEAAILAAK